MFSKRLPAALWLAVSLLLGAGCSGLPVHSNSPCCPIAGAASPLVVGGIYPTVVSPYTCAGVDIAALEKQIHYQLCNGVHGLLVLGTMGEGHLLCDEERAKVIATAVRVAAGRAPVIVGIHTCDVQVALAQLQQARELGATAVLVKYYGNSCASECSVLAFFAALSESGVLPIIVYHYPSDTGVRLSPATIAAILRLANVIGIKESTLDLREMAAHMRQVQCEGKLFFTSSALNLTQFLKMGGHGAMCPEAAILPKLTVDCYDAATTCCWKQARDLQKDLYNLVPLYGRCPTSPFLARCILMPAFDHHIPIPFMSSPMPARFKEALNHLCIPTPTYAGPCRTQLNRWDIHQVGRTMKTILPLVDCPH